MYVYTQNKKKKIQLDVKKIHKHINQTEQRAWILYTKKKKKTKK